MKNFELINPEIVIDNKNNGFNGFNGFIGTPNLNPCQYYFNTENFSEYIIILELLDPNGYITIGIKSKEKNNAALYLNCNHSRLEFKKIKTKILKIIISPISPISPSINNTLQVFDEDDNKIELNLLSHTYNNSYNTNKNIILLIGDLVSSCESTYFKIIEIKENKKGVL